MVASTADRLVGDGLPIPGNWLAVVVRLEAIDHREQATGDEIRREQFSFRHVALEGFG